MKGMEWLLNVVVRGVLGLGIIYMVNQVLANEGIEIMVGLNAITFLASGILGIPGVGLMYGMMWYQLL